MAEPWQRGSSGRRVDTTYKYAVRGPVLNAVMDELHRGHALRNRLVELELAYQEAKTAAWEEDPHVAAAASTVAVAETAHTAARDALAAARIRAARGRRQGRTPTGPSLSQDVATARQAAAAAKDTLRAARDTLRRIKAERWPQAQRAITAARQARDQAITGTYAEWRDKGMYWGTWADLVASHKTAVARVSSRRAAGRPAQLRYRRWDGTGTITVQLARQLGVTAAERAEVTALKAHGLTPGQIAERTRFSARTAARMKPQGPAKAGEPPFTPAVLASRQGRSRNVFGLGPEPPPDYLERPRSERRQLARQGWAEIRIGTGEAQALARVPVTIHRPMAAGAEVKLARLTVTRCGPDTAQHLTVVASVPAPAARPPAGSCVAVHTGWRVLADGSIRVAVVAGAGPAPHASVIVTGTVRQLPPDSVQGSLWEVIIPSRWRDDQAAVDKAHSRRDAAFNIARDQAAAWIDAHPAAAGNLPPAAEVRQWRSPRRLAVLAARAAAAQYGETAQPLGQLLGSGPVRGQGAEQDRPGAPGDPGWAQHDRRAWRNESRARRRLTARRDDAWAKVAVWLGRDASRIIVDGWDLSELARRPAPETADDDPQAAAARANLRLAAPGVLREKIASAARLRGTAVEHQDGTQVQAHWQCGGELAPGERQTAILVLCRRCGVTVDQDVNMLRLMLAG